MESKRILKVLPVLFGFFIMGFCDIVGIASDYVQRTFDWSSTMTGFIPSMVFVWFLFLGIPVGNMMNKWGRKNTVLISLVITIIGMMLPLIDYTSPTCIAAFMLLGIGNAILQVSLNPLLTDVVNGSYATSALTAGQVIKAVSSLLGPEFILIAMGIFGEAHWYYCFPIMGAITIVSALWLALTPIASNKTAEEGIGMIYTFRLLRDPKVLLLFLGIFFIVGVDVSTNYISSKLMVQRFSWAETQAKWAPQVYFICRTVGAFVGVLLLPHVREIRYFRYNIVACLLALFMLLLFVNPVINLVCIGCVGFFASSVFSIIYSIALRYKPDEANRMSGLMITAIAGGGLVTPFMGFSIDMAGISGGVLVTLLCVCYLVFCAFAVKNY